MNTLTAYSTFTFFKFIFQLNKLAESGLYSCFALSLLSGLHNAETVSMCVYMLCCCCCAAAAIVVVVVVDCIR